MQILRLKLWIVAAFNQDGETALMMACARGHLDCVSLLIEHRADVDCCNAVFYVSFCVALIEYFFRITGLFLILIKHFVNASLTIRMELQRFYWLFKTTP